MAPPCSVPVPLVSLARIILLSLLFSAVTGTAGCDVDQDEDGWTGSDGDCDDQDPQTYPGADELCDGADKDCDRGDGPGQIDDGLTLFTWYLDQDSDGYGDDAQTLEACDAPALAGHVPGSARGLRSRGLRLRRPRWVPPAMQLN